MAICRPGCNVAMDTSGNHKAKNLNSATVVCRTKNTPYILRFYSVHLSNTNTRNIYYRWPYNTNLIKDALRDTFLYKRNIEATSVSFAAVLRLRAQSELSHCGRRTVSHTHFPSDWLTQWPTSTTWNGKINSRWQGTTETKPDRLKKGKRQTDITLDEWRDTTGAAGELCLNCHQIFGPFLLTPENRGEQNLGCWHW